MMVHELWNLTTDIPDGNVTGALDDVTSTPGDDMEAIKWAIICSFCFIFGLSIASAIYFWDQRNKPKNVKKRRLKRISDRKKKEEKAIAAIKKEPIQVDQFLRKLRQKKLDKYLNFEVRNMNQTHNLKRGTPGKPEDVKMKELKTSSVTLTLSKPKDDAGSKIDSYFILLKEDDGEFKEVAELKSYHSDYKIKDLAIVRNQEEYPCTIASQPDNASRNICQDVISYDHSSVILKKVPPKDDSNYINASYIEGAMIKKDQTSKGYHNQKEYIATQGPRGKQVAAFWHMVWQENVHVIVMATGLFENAAQQCDKYWGDILSVQKYVRHGDIHIVLKDKLELSKLVIRTFQICEDGCDEPRTVKHFEMTGFTDDSTDPGFLLDVWRRVNRTMLTVPGPMLVHCRCGGGRTAVFIAIDYCLKQLERENFVDIYSTVLHLRKFRKNMVRSLSQYRLIYDTLAMYVQVWTTVIPCAQLPAVAHKLMLKDPQTNLLGFEKEFQFLQDIVPKISIGDCASGHRDENRNKSRDIMLLPPERARPYLQTIETNETGTDFINGVFVDGYHSDNSFIVTQWPMQSTINDIWRLLFDFKINTFVVLHESKLNRSVPCFWPKVLDEEVKYGPIGVKYLGCQKYPHIIIRAFAIRKKASSLPLIDLLTQNTDSIVVKMFQYTSWHQRDKIPTSTKSFLYMMGCVDEWQQKTNSQSPICVMSKDGYSKCGLYCTLNICCDQIHCEKEVDIFNAVRVVKKNRPQLIPTLPEYIYCYSYMSLIIHLMLEDSPKLMVTSPTVIEGEIQQGYELLTGFENILCAQPTEEDKNGTSLKNQNHTSAFTANFQHDSKDSSFEGLNTHDLDSQTLLCGEKLVESGHKKSSGIMADNVNGHIHKNGQMQPQREEKVTAPAAPGQIRVWDSDTVAHFNESASAELKMPRRQSTKRRPFYRQNAQEMNEIRTVDYPKSTKKDILESSYL